MNRCLLLALLFVFAPCAWAGGLSTTTPEIDDWVVLRTETTQFSTGASYDATAITFTVLEFADNATVSVAAVSVGLTDVAMTKILTKTGRYAAAFQCTAAAGFEVDKNYSVDVEATVDGVSSAISYSFRVVDYTTVAEMVQGWLDGILGNGETLGAQMLKIRNW